MLAPPGGAERGSRGAGGGKGRWKMDRGMRESKRPGGAEAVPGKHPCTADDPHILWVTGCVSRHLVGSQLRAPRGPPPFVLQEKARNRDRYPQEFGGVPACPVRNWNGVFTPLGTHRRDRAHCAFSLSRGEAPFALHRWVGLEITPSRADAYTPKCAGSRGRARARRDLSSPERNHDRFGKLVPGGERFGLRGSARSAISALVPR